MAKIEGFVYYEADCFMNFINPYIGLDVENPSLDVKRQKPLKGYSKETILAASRGLEIFQGMSQGKSPNTPEAKRFFIEMAKNVKFEKERLSSNSQQMSQSVNPPKLILKHYFGRTKKLLRLQSLSKKHAKIRLWF